MTYEDGHLDAMARKTAASDDPSYKLGYLDGVFERAAKVVEGAFRDRTITGLEFRVVPKAAVLDGEGALWSVMDREGRLVTRGEAIDVEHGVARCEGVAKHLGEPVARLASIERTIRGLHPEMGHPEVQRLAGRVAEYIIEHGKRA